MVLSIALIQSYTKHHLDLMFSYGSRAEDEDEYEDDYEDKGKDDDR